MHHPETIKVIRKGNDSDYVVINKGDKLDTDKEYKEPKKAAPAASKAPNKKG